MDMYGEKNPSLPQKTIIVAVELALIAVSYFVLFGPLLSEKLLYYPTVTREPFRNRGRITDLISSEQLFNDIHQSPLNIETDRIMMCGSPGMLEELKQMFESGGFVEGSGSKPGHFVIEKAFVER